MWNGSIDVCWRQLTTHPCGAEPNRIAIGEVREVYSKYILDPSATLDENSKQLVEMLDEYIKKYFCSSILTLFSIREIKWLGGLQPH